MSTRIVSWLITHGRVLWLVAIALAIPAGWRTVELYTSLNSEFEALLPRDAPSVRALDELRARMPPLQFLGVVVDTQRSDQLDAGERFVDDLARRVERYPSTLVKRVRTGTGEERKFLEANAPLYLSLGDLDQIEARIERRRDAEIAHASGNAIDEDEPLPALDFSDLERKYEEEVGTSARVKSSKRGRFSDTERHLTALLIEVGPFEHERGLSPAALLRRVRADVASLGAERYAPGLRVGFTGDVAISVEESEALTTDLSLSSLVVGCLTLVVLVVYYRWWRSVVVILAPLLLSVLYAFGLASVPPFDVRELNSNTAFLGSIVVGNGINFGIILLARYVEERRRGLSPREAMFRAHALTRSGTIAAACAAGSSYAALALTRFQGFHQFGYIGGIGMVASWITAYALVPSLALALDREPESAPRATRSAGKPTRLVARLVTRAHVPIVIASVAFTVVSLWAVRSLDASSLEHDFSQLRRRDTWTSGEGYWGGKMNELLGTYLTPIVILTDSPEKAAAVAATVRASSESGELRALVSSVRTAADVLPDRQAEKLERAETIRELLTPAMRRQLPASRAEVLDHFLGNDSLRPITADDLPPALVAGLRERNGVIDRAVLIYPRPSRSLWEGPAIAHLVSTLREAARAGPGPPGRVAGALPVSHDIIAAIERDGPIASAAAFGFVVVVVLLLFRWSMTSALVLATLVSGVLWLAGVTVLSGVKINFSNFIAFPITFGIGVDYAVNVMTRYVKDGRTDVAAAIRSTGGAVGLCSLTTIIGYSSLLMAQNRALFLFGLLAVMGELTCLIAAVVALPAALSWWKRSVTRPASLAA